MTDVLDYRHEDIGRGAKALSVYQSNITGDHGNFAIG